MKKLFARVLSIILVLLMIFSLVACAPADNDETKPNGDTSTQDTGEKEREHLTLIMYTQGPDQVGRDDMIQELNKYLKEKLNVTLDLRLSKDYTSTMGTRIDAGEDWDICLVGHGVDFQAYARRNAFAPLNDYMDLLPGTTGQVNSDAMSLFTIDDNIYGVPVLKDAWTQYGWTINQTLLDDLGLEFPEWATKQDLVEFLLDVKEARDKKYPDDAGNALINDVFYQYEQWITGELIVGGWNKPLVHVNVSEETGYKGISVGDTAFCPIYTPEYREIMKSVRELVKGGVGCFDSASFDPDGVLLNSGKLLGSCGAGLISVAEDVNPNYKSAYYPSTVSYASAVKYGFAVNAKCENVDRAVEVLELLQNDTYAATVLHFGPEGKGWTDTNNDNVIELTELNSDSKNRYWYNWYGWTLGGVTAMKAIPGSATNYMEKMKELNRTAEPTPNFGFVFDSEPVENQIAAVSNVFAEYHAVLQTGQNDNVDQLVDEFIAELKANGMDEIVAEAQRQLDAWREANGK